MEKNKVYNAEVETNDYQKQIIYFGADSVAVTNISPDYKLGNCKISDDSEQVVLEDRSSLLHSTF